ncbi:MAG: glycerol-3-phosphate acyltransferase [Candidatus Coproplasma sp.]
MFCRTIPALLTHKDVCEISDDKNPGAFNVFKHFGKGLGLLCLALDVLKGFLPVFLACILLERDSAMLSLVMIAPVLGHAVGMFNRFHGGKCISTAFGVMLGILPVTVIPLILLAVLYILFSTLIKINPNKLRSIITFTLFGIASAIICCVLNLFNVAFGCLIIAVIAIVKHVVAKETDLPADAKENNASV